MLCGFDCISSFDFDLGFDLGCKMVDKEELEKKTNEMGLCEQEKNELSDLLCMETLNEEGEKQEEEGGGKYKYCCCTCPIVRESSRCFEEELKVAEDRRGPGSMSLL